MSKQAKTPYAILGLLTIAPMSGYDLKTFYDRSLRFFWNESFGQIYPALKRMEAEGLVTGHDETAARGKLRRVHTITPAGRDYLRAWLELPVDQYPVRNELLLKVFFGAEVPVETIRGHIAEALEQAETRLNIYEAIKEGVRAENPDPHSRAMHLLTLDYGRHAVQALTGWCRDSLKILEELEGNFPNEKK